MKDDYTQLRFDDHACPRTTINLGMWSYVAPGIDHDGDLVVSGLREGVRYYRYENHDDDGVPQYGCGEPISGLDGWNLNVIPYDGPGGRGLFVRSGGGFLRTGVKGVPDMPGSPAETGVEGVLGLHGLGRYVSTGTLFRRRGSERYELIVTVVDMSDYYPGEYGVYGGRAIGIDQLGRNVGYNEDGEWLGGRGRGELYLFVIESNRDALDARCAGRLSCHGKPLATLDRSGSNAVADFDGDGNLEAIILDGWQFDSYRFSPACGDPELTALGAVEGSGGRYELDIQFPSPAAIRYPRRELPDIVAGSFSGELFFAENRTSLGGPITLSALRPVCGRDRELRIGGFAVPSLADIDGDGLLDIVVGDEDGHMSFVKNVGTAQEAAWAAPQLLLAEGRVIRIVSGYSGNIQGPDERLHGYACPCAVDWTGNGRVDLVVGDITGYFSLYERAEADGNTPAFKEPVRFSIEGEELRGEWRVRPAVADLHATGSLELIVLDTQGMVTAYRNSERGGAAAVEPGERLTDNLGRWIRLDRLSGAQGRAKLVACDWTGSGTIDIIVGTGRTTPLPSLKSEGIPKGRATFMLLENVGDPERPIFIYRPLSLLDGSLVDLGTHSCAPAVGDINGDGNLEIIAGEETGRLFLFDRDQFDI